MKKIAIIGMLAAVLLLFAQCKNEQKSEPKSGEAQVENQDKAAAEGDAAAENVAEPESDGQGEEGGADIQMPLSFSGDQPTVKDVVAALPGQFSPEVLGEEAEMENPGSTYEAMAAAVKSGKGAEGEEVKIDEEKGTVWFKQTYGEEATVIGVKLAGDKAIVDFRHLMNGKLSPAQFDGIEVYKVDTANKKLIYESQEGEALIDDKGNLK